MIDKNELIAALDGRIIGGHLHNGGYIHVPLEEAEQIYYLLTKQSEVVMTLPQWISVNDRLPENANHPRAFCPRYNVMTEYGVTQGWFNPDKECWFVLAWFIYAKPDFYKAQFLDMTHGDIPYVTNKIKVTHWMPLPEPPEEVKQDG